MRHPFDFDLAELEAIHATMQPLTEEDLSHITGGRAATTMATGEEGGGDPTTMATGEEGGGYRFTAW
jgi:bacteriocin-like protein